MLPDSHSPAAARPHAMRRAALFGWGTVLAGLLLPLTTATATALRQLPASGALDSPLQLSLA